MNNRAVPKSFTSHADEAQRCASPRGNKLWTLSLGPQWSGAGFETEVDLEREPLSCNAGASQTEMPIAPESWTQAMQRKNPYRLKLQMPSSPETLRTLIALFSRQSRRGWGVEGGFTFCPRPRSSRRRSHARSTAIRSIRLCQFAPSSSGRSATASHVRPGLREPELARSLTAERVTSGGAQPPVSGRGSRTAPDFIRNRGPSAPLRVAVAVMSVEQDRGLCQMTCRGGVIQKDTTGGRCRRPPPQMHVTCTRSGRCKNTKRGRGFVARWPWEGPARAPSALHAHGAANSGPPARVVHTFANKDVWHKMCRWVSVCFSRNISPTVCNDETRQ